MVMLCVQGSESEARKRLPQGMSPPWKVTLPLLIEAYLVSCVHKGNALPNIDLSGKSLQVPTCQTTVPFWCILHAAVPELHDLLQVMLLSDGSVTRHLQLLTDLPVQVVSLCSVSHQSNAWH